MKIIMSIVDSGSFLTLPKSPKSEFFQGVKKSQNLEKPLWGIWLTISSCQVGSHCTEFGRILAYRLAANRGSARVKCLVHGRPRLSLMGSANRLEAKHYQTINRWIGSQWRPNFWKASRLDGYCGKFKGIKKAIITSRIPSRKGTSQGVTQ